MYCTYNLLYFFDKKMKVLLAALLVTACTSLGSPCKSHVLNTMGTEHAVPLGRNTLVVSGQSFREFNSGALALELRVAGVLVAKETRALCDLVACPVSERQVYRMEIDSFLPSDAPITLGSSLRVTVHDDESDSASSCAVVQVDVDQQLLGAAGESLIQSMFKYWKREYPHVFNPDFATFSANLAAILEHNKNPRKTFRMALNEFGAMSQEQFVRTRLRLRESTDPDKTKFGSMVPHYRLSHDVSMADPLDELDWSTRGVVTRVKNQGSCGSCWAFSAVGSLESALAIKTGELVELSEQELVSCDTNDYGCQGGLMDSAFEWIMASSRGLCTENDYQYSSGDTSASGECQSSSCEPVSGTVPKGYYDIPPQESALVAALNQHGPVAVAVEADQSAFQFYHSGVLTGVCGSQLDHGVLLVGYGIDEDSGIPFWKVKNSWGSAWGEQGYIRILRGRRWPQGSECGIASKASYPIL